MKKIAVIYKSLYGFTGKYAGWIADELNANLLNADKVKPVELLNYDIIIYGGGLYAGGLSGVSLITKNFDSIKNKDLYIFTVGVADVSDKNNTDNIRKSLSKVLTPEMQQKIKLYSFRGGIDYKRMSFIHRVMMSMFVKMLKKKPQNELGKEDKLMIETFGKCIDFSDRSSICYLLQDIKSQINL